MLITIEIWLKVPKGMVKFNKIDFEGKTLLYMRFFFFFFFEKRVVLNQNSYLHPYSNKIKPASDNAMLKKFLCILKFC